LSRKAKANLEKGQSINFDLYEPGDGMYTSFSLDGRAERNLATSTPPKDVMIKVFRSGWNKPTILLAMLLGLDQQDKLSIGGKRRLVRLLTSQSIDVQIAANSRSQIAYDPRFEVLAIWVNRPFHLRSFRKRSKRRIGVGYSDKGSSLPSHQRGRREHSDSIFIGEKREYLWNLNPETAMLIQDYGYLFNHISGGWWEPDIRLKLHLRSLNLINRSP
jgi:hypothetical protein